MAEIVGIVHIRAAQDKVDEVVAAFTTCIEKTHEEEGCLAYALHRDSTDPAHLILIERWRSQQDMDAHMTKPYIADLFEVVGQPGMLAGAPELTFATPMGVGTAEKGSLG
jgi:quinol monooxygenase YgiN